MYIYFMSIWGRRYVIVLERTAESRFTVASSHFDVLLYWEKMLNVQMLEADGPWTAESFVLTPSVLGSILERDSSCPGERFLLAAGSIRSLSSAAILKWQARVHV